MGTVHLQHYNKMKFLIYLVVVMTLLFVTSQAKFLGYCSDGSDCKAQNQGPYEYRCDIDWDSYYAKKKQAANSVTENRPGVGYGSLRYRMINNLKPHGICEYA